MVGVGIFILVFEGGFNLVDVVQKYVVNILLVVLIGSLQIGWFFNRFRFREIEVRY